MAPASACLTAFLLLLHVFFFCVKECRSQTLYTPSLSWRKAHATFYGGSDASGTMGGACGYGNLYTTGYGTATAALSGPLFKAGAACGACFELKCYTPTGGTQGTCVSGTPTVIVTATNLCPQGSLGGWCDPPNLHFDMAEPSYLKIGIEVAGVINVKFRRVRCVKTGGMRITMNGNANFNLVLITNVGGAGDVRSARIKGSNTGWLKMTRNWGENWECDTNLVGQALSISVTTSDKQTLISYNIADADWLFGQTFEGSQYP